jgi:hypothetical protein
MDLRRENSPPYSETDQVIVVHKPVPDAYSDMLNVV